MTDVEKYFKEWGSICRLFEAKDNPIIHNHKTLLQFAEDYHKHKLKQLVPANFQSDLGDGVILTTKEKDYILHFKNGEWKEIKQSNS